MRKNFREIKQERPLFVCREIMFCLFAVVVVVERWGERGRGEKKVKGRRARV